MCQANELKNNEWNIASKMPSVLARTSHRVKLSAQRAGSDSRSYGFCIMKETVPAPELPFEGKIDESLADPSEFISLVDEVRARSSKPTTNPTTIPQKLSTSEFNTAMVHFYRGEIQRSNVWRNRLDATTNWAVITTGATLSFAFSSSDNPPFVIPLNTVLVAVFLFMEARRYRYYEVWASRVRVLETGYFAPMLSHHSIAPDEEWADHLSKDLLLPHFNISVWEAMGRRLRSNYLWIMILLTLSWCLKVYVHPRPVLTIAEFVSRAQIGPAPGWLVILFAIASNCLLIYFATVTSRFRDAESEVLPLKKFEWQSLKQVSTWAETNLARRNKVRRAKKARHRVRGNSPDASKNIHGTMTSP